MKEKLLLLTLVLWSWAFEAEASNQIPNVSILITTNSADLKAAEWVQFSTRIRNEGSTTISSLVTHLSIAGFIEGQHVDPEDWSPQRTQFVTPLAPGQSLTQNWRIHALFEGKFLVYVTVISSEKPYTLVVSPSFLLHVSPDNILPLSEVILVAALVPLFPLGLLVTTILFRLRRYRGEQS